MHNYIILFMCNWNMLNIIYYENNREEITEVIIYNSLFTWIRKFSDNNHMTINHSQLLGQVQGTPHESIWCKTYIEHILDISCMFYVKAILCKMAKSLPSLRSFIHIRVELYSFYYIQQLINISYEIYSVSN